MHHRVDENEDVRRCTEEEGDDASVAQRASQGWEEVLEAGRTSDTHVGDGQHVGLRVGQSQFETPDLRRGTSLVDIGFGSLDRQSSVGNMFHLWGKRLPGVWEIGQDKHDQDSNGDGYGSFDDVKPLPTGESIQLAT